MKNLWLCLLVMSGSEIVMFLSNDHQLIYFTILIHVVDVIYRLHGTSGHIHDWSLLLFDEEAKMYKWSRKRSFESVGHLSSLLFRPISPSSYLLAWKTRERSDGRDFVVKLIKVEKDNGFNIYWKSKQKRTQINWSMLSPSTPSLLPRSSSSSCGDCIAVCERIWQGEVPV